MFLAFLGGSKAFIVKTMCVLIIMLVYRLVEGGELWMSHNDALLYTPKILTDKMHVAKSKLYKPSYR